MKFRRLLSGNAAPNINLILPAENNTTGTSSGTHLQPSDTTARSIVNAVDGAIQILEASRSTLLEPMMHLAASAEALAAMAKAISERPVEVQPAPVAAGDELKTAIDRLTAMIEQLAERPVEVQPAPVAAGGPGTPAPSRARRVPATRRLTNQDVRPPSAAPVHSLWGSVLDRTARMAARTRTRAR